MVVGKGVECEVEVKDDDDEEEEDGGHRGQEQLVVEGARHLPGRLHHSERGVRLSERVQRFQLSFGKKGLHFYWGLPYMTSTKGGGPIA